MQLELLNEQGQAASKIDAPETVLVVNTTKIRCTRSWSLTAIARQGTRAQKDREQVRHSTKKPFKQRVPAARVLV